MQGLSKPTERRRELLIVMQSPVARRVPGDRVVSCPLKPSWKVPPVTFVIWTSLARVAVAGVRAAR